MAVVSEKRLEMKFQRDVPNKDGYYWMLNTEYPIPIPVFVSNSNDGYFEGGTKRGTLKSALTYKYIRWGDEIEVPTIKDTQIEEPEVTKTDEVLYDVSLSLTHIEIELLRNSTSDLGVTDTECVRLHLKIANSLLDSGYLSFNHKGE